MDLGFRGEVAEFYHRYRRGYPPPVIDALVDAVGLTAADLVLDLGCGTGHLTLPLAGHARAVVGVDPEPDMLAQGRRSAGELGLGNATWLVGADTDVPAIGAVLGEGSLGAVTIGQALHWMVHEQLFPALRPLLRPGGAVVVVTNGVPMWMQDSAWSRALRDCLADWLGTPVGNFCGSDPATQDRYRESLVAAGFEVGQAGLDYTDDLDLDRVVGAVYSALAVDRLPAPDQRTEFAERIERAVAPHGPLVEQVAVRMVIGRRAPAPGSASHRADPSTAN
jgi:SAM-dependent methyltransferase